MERERANETEKVKERKIKRERAIGRTVFNSGHTLESARGAFKNYRSPSITS